jgi:hypothetical protein
MKIGSLTRKDCRIGTVQVAAACLAFTLLLAFPGSGAADPVWQASANSQEGLSKAFTQSATTALIAIHQAKQNIANVVSKNQPIGYYNPNLAAQAYDQVRQSQIAASTGGDQQAATLLNAYFMKVKTWAEQYKAARESMNATNTMGENMLAQDSGWQAIESCEKSFNTMLINRVYNDIPACH